MWPYYWSKSVPTIHTSQAALLLLATTATSECCILFYFSFLFRPTTCVCPSVRTDLNHLPESREACILYTRTVITSTETIHETWTRRKHRRKRCSFHLNTWVSKPRPAIQSTVTGLAFCREKVRGPRRNTNKFAYTTIDSQAERWTDTWIAVWRAGRWIYKGVDCLKGLLNYFHKIMIHYPC